MAVAASAPAVAEPPAAAIGQPAAARPWQQDGAQLAAALGAILLLGFCLRLFRLDFQSLWYDETYSVAIARGTFAGVGAVPEAEPLLHYYLLWGWIRAAGDSVFAMRALSAFAGTLLAPVLYQVVRLTLRRRGVALLATLLMAVSPYAINYSQEVRLHIFAGLLAGAATWALLASLRKGTASCWLAYTILAVLGLYTSYYLALLLLALNLPLLVRGPRSRGWLLANASAVALALPGVALGLSRLAAFREPYPVIQALLDPARFARITPGIVLFASLPEGLSIGLGLATLLLALAGAWRLGRTRLGLVLASGAMLTYLLVFAVPAGLRISYYDRYELLALPGLLALLAVGLAGLKGWWRAPVALALLLGTGLALFNGYANPSFQRDDNRDALALISQQAQPDEMLIYDLPLLYTVVDYYAPNLAIPREGLPLAKNRKLPPERQFLAATSDRPATEQELAKLLSEHAGFWLLLSGDPTQWTEEWLDSHSLPVLNRWFGNARVKHYRQLPPDGPATLAGGQPADRAFGPLRLRQVRPGPLIPGKDWPVYLAWETAVAPTADYTVSLQLFDPRGQRVAQHDSEPFDGALPTSRWTPGKAYDDLVVLPALPALTPGVYQLRLAVYGGGLSAPVQTVALLSRGLMPASLPPAASSAGWTVDSVAMRASTGGYDVAVGGSVQAAPTADYTWFVHALDASGKLLAQDDHPPTAPTSSWRAGERFEEAFHLAAAPPRGATLELGAYDVNGRRAMFGGGADHLIVQAA